MNAAGGRERKGRTGTGWKGRTRRQGKVIREGKAGRGAIQGSDRGKREAGRAT